MLHQINARSEQPLAPLNEAEFRALLEVRLKMRVFGVRTLNLAVVAWVGVVWQLSAYHRRSFLSSSSCFSTERITNEWAMTTTFVRSVKRYPARTHARTHARTYAGQVGPASGAVHVRAV